MGKMWQKENSKLTRKMFEAVRANLKLEKEEKTDHTDDVVNEEVYETAAVIAMTEEEASDIYRLLENRGISAFYVDRDTSVFHKGLTVTTYYLAKGLEFDQVFVVKSKKENPFEKTGIVYQCDTGSSRIVCVRRIRRKNEGYIDLWGINKKDEDYIDHCRKDKRKIFKRCDRGIFKKTESNIAN